MLGPTLLNFASPDTVYLDYGMFYAVAVAVAGSLAAMIAARSVRPHRPAWDERWGWRLTFAGYGVMLLGSWATTVSGWAKAPTWSSSPAYCLACPATCCWASGCCEAVTGPGSLRS